ncbi:hypothetical protein FACS189444_3510 [Spirochaetia bacterium]|nr:hypothetical protein FACS189444_3510 [Spirochaetia bacterium]
MLVLDGFFRDNTFIPDRAVTIPDGAKAIVSVEEAPQQQVEKIALQKKAWHEFFDGIRGLNEELSPKFDEIIERGIHFNKVDFL